MHRLQIISPSGAIDPQLIDLTETYFRHIGWQVGEGRCARSRYGRFAATAQERLQDLMEAITDSQNDVVLCARGGYGLQQIIDSLPHWTPEQHLPLIVGFSDITCLHQWCARQGRVSLHAMMCKGLSQAVQDNDHAALEQWVQAVEGTPLRYVLPAHELNRHGQACGKLIGGNLSVLYGLQATPLGLDKLVADGKEKQHILFIEDISERHYHIDRMMNNLRMSGVLAHISGLVVGQMTDCEDDPGMSCSVMQTIAQAVADYDFPVLFGFPAGHDHPNLPLRMGATCRLNINSDHVLLQQ